MTSPDVNTIHDDPPTFEPAVDSAGEVLWLDHRGDVAWLPAGDEAPEGWRRLYVEAATGGAV